MFRIQIKIRRKFIIVKVEKNFDKSFLNFLREDKYSDNN